MKKIPRLLLLSMRWLLGFLLKRLNRSLINMTANGRTNKRTYSWRLICVARVRNAQVAIDVRIEKTEEQTSYPSSTSNGEAKARDDPERIEMRN